MSAVTKYRTLLRAIGTVFRGDLHAMSACKGQARAAFMQQANVADPELIKKLLADADEAVEFLVHNVAQAKLNDSGRYELQLQQSFAEADGNINIQTPQDAVAAKDKKEGCCGGGCH